MRGDEGWGVFWTVWFEELSFSFSPPLHKVQQISCGYIAVSYLKLNLCGNLWAAVWNLPIPRQRWKLSLTKMTPRPDLVQLNDSALQRNMEADWFSAHQLLCSNITFFFGFPGRPSQKALRRVFLTGRPSFLHSRRQWKSNPISIWCPWLVIDQLWTSGTYRTLFLFLFLHASQGLLWHSHTQKNIKPG